MKDLSLPEEIKGERLVLKKNSLEHAEEIFKCVDSNRVRLREFMHWIDITNTVEDEINFIKNSEMYLGRPMRSYGMFYNGKYIGNISAHNIVLEHDLCELGFWIDGNYEGKGFVSEAVRILEETLRTQGFKKIELGIEPQNTRSINLAKKNKYEYRKIEKKKLWSKEIEFMIFCKELV